MSTPSTPPPEYTEEDARALFPNPSPLGTNTATRPLPRPVCIPQISASFDSPFVRAYPPIELSGITLDDWIKFLDGLNIALIGSPPLQIVTVVGMAISFVPSIACQVVGTALQVGSQVGLRVLSKSLTEKYLKYTNDEFFRPRGLVVRLCATPAMLQLVSPDSPASNKKGRMKKAGGAAESLALKLPIVGPIVAGFTHKKSGEVDVNAGLSLVERRMKALEPRVMPLSFEVPPVKTPAGILDKTSSLSVKLRRHNASTKEQKALQARQQAAIENGTASPETIAAASGPGLSGPAGRIGDYFSTGAAILRPGDGTPRPPSASGSGTSFGSVVGGFVANVQGRKPQSPLTGLLGSEAQGQAKIADRQEKLETNNLVWLVLMNIEEDAIIEGREDEDSNEPLRLTEEEYQHIPRSWSHEEKQDTKS